MLHPERRLSLGAGTRTEDHSFGATIDLHLGLHRGQARDICAVGSYELLRREVAGNVIFLAGGNDFEYGVSDCHLLKLQTLGCVVI